LLDNHYLVYTYDLYLDVDNEWVLYSFIFSPNLNICEETGVSKSRCSNVLESFQTIHSAQLCCVFLVYPTRMMWSALWWNQRINWKSLFHKELDRFAFKKLSNSLYPTEALRDPQRPSSLTPKITSPIIFFRRVSSWSALTRNKSAAFFSPQWTSLVLVSSHREPRGKNTSWWWDEISTSWPTPYRQNRLVLLHLLTAFQLRMFEELFLVKSSAKCKDIVVF
jgi:hypothetical protein